MRFARSLTVALTAALLASALPASIARALDERAMDALSVTLSAADGGSSGPETESSPTIARLVRLPAGATAATARALLHTSAAGTREISADLVKVSPVLIARGQPMVVVSVPASAIEKGARLDVEIEPRGAQSAPLSHRLTLDTVGGTHRGIYMIIAADEYVAALQDLVTWKTASGYKVSVHPISETGSSVQSIRTFVSNAYHTWDEPPLYLLLVGDIDKVPTGNIGGYVSDHVYAAVDGDDFLPDIYVGRFSASNPTQVATQVAKTVGYESRPDTTSGDGEWFSRALMVAANQGSSTPLATLHWAGDELLEHGYAKVDSCFQGRRAGHIGREEGPFCIKNFVDQGVSLVGYRGWARGDFGWEYPLYDVSHVPSLNNGWRMPVVFSVVCHTGNYGNQQGDCFGEVWMKLGSPESPRGAVGFIGTAEHWSHSRWNDRISIGIWQAFADKGIRDLGMLLADTKISMLEQFPNEIFMAGAPIDEEETCEYYAYIYNILGDPGLTVWNAKPRHLTVEHEEQLSLGQNLVATRVLGGGGTPVAEALVSLAQAGEPVGLALTGADGWAYVPLRAIDAGTVTLTVTGDNLYPYSAQLPMTAATGYLTCTNATATDPGLVPGISTDVTLELTNTGSGTVTQVTGDLEPPSGVITGPETLTFGAITAGGTGSTTVAITVDPETENGTRLPFLLHAEGNATALNSTRFELSVVAPELTVAGVDDGDDGIFSPGESASLALTLHNGSIPAGDMALTLRIGRPGVLSLTDSTETLSAIGTGMESETAANAFSIAVSPDAAVGTIVPMTLLAQHSQGPRSVIHFSLTVGEIDYAAPTGPDRYGYYCLDSADIDYPGQAPVYRWIECSPLFGGSGTFLPGVDDNVWSAVLELPFAFRFYGVEYDSVRVDDNGWIAFDTSFWVDIRNWSMPDTWGAGAMLAAFWDNLVPPVSSPPDKTDGIYYYHDEEQHCFVVEWSRLKNWENTTDDLQTFQIILRDPAHHPTPTGDGEILFQYKQIVNDDWTRMYATVGIEDHTETDGICYTYGNIYAPGAMPLSPGLAIKFTTEPPVYQAIELARFTAAQGGGVSLTWSYTDPRPLTGFELYRLEAEEAGDPVESDATVRWGRPLKLHTDPLAPRSGDFHDTGAAPAGRYLYRMIGHDAHGKARVLGEVEVGGPHTAVATPLLPEGNVLAAGGRIALGLSDRTMQALAIHDLSGRVVRDLSAAASTARGAATLPWDGRDEQGRPVPGGVYWVRATGPEGARTARLVVVR